MTCCSTTSLVELNIRLRFCYLISLPFFMSVGVFGFNVKINGGKLVQSGVWSSCDSCHDTYVSVCCSSGVGRDRTWVFRDFHQPSTQILEPSGTQRLRPRSLPWDSLCAVASNVWLVLSRSWPSTHFLPGGHSDSRVKFIWYFWISATWKCQVSGINPHSFDTLVSVMTPLRPYRPSVHLDSPPIPQTHHTHTEKHTLCPWLVTSFPTQWEVLLESQIVYCFCSLS